MVAHCCVKGCNNNGRIKKNNKNVKPVSVTFHSFPSNPECKVKWLQAIGRPTWTPSIHARICSAHFHSDQVNIDGHRKRIKCDAIPVLALPPNSNFDASDIEVCRMCLAADVKMFSLKHGKLKICLESIPGFNENQIEGLPQFACYECAAGLYKWYKLLGKSLTAQATLLDIYVQNGQITKTLINKQNRHQLNLTSSLSYQRLTSYLDIKHKDTICQRIIDKRDYHSNCNDKSDYHSNCNDKSDYSSNFNDTISLANKLTDSNAYLISEQHSNYDIEIDVDVENSVQTLESDPDVNRIQLEEIFTEPMINVDTLNDDDDSINGLPNSPINGDFPCNGDVELKQDLVVKIERGKKVGPRRRIKKEINTSETAPTEEALEIDKYFDIVSLSLEQQLEDWQRTYVKSANSEKLKYKCDVCGRTFAQVNTYNKHMADHDPSSGSVECPVCHLRYQNDLQLRNHVQRSHANRFHCKACPKIFSDLRVASHHVRWHSPQPACSLCGRSFATLAGLRVHTTTTHRDHPEVAADNPHRCEKCKLSFRTEGARRVHLLTSVQHATDTDLRDSVEMANVCRSCGEQFPSSPELIAHRREKHPRPPKKKLSWQMPGDNYPTTCEHCGQAVASRREHWAHRQRVHPRAPYRPVVRAVCHACGKGFQSVTKLRFHLMRHSGLTVSCGECGRACPDGPALRRHARAHAPPPFECACGRAFTHRHGLQRHARVHTGATPYECPICSKKFKHSPTVKLHVRTVHFKMPYPPKKRTLRTARKDENLQENVVN